MDHCIQLSVYFKLNQFKASLAETVRDIVHSSRTRRCHYKNEPHSVRVHLDSA